MILLIFNLLQLAKYIYFFICTELHIVDLKFKIKISKKDPFSVLIRKNLIKLKTSLVYLILLKEFNLLEQFFFRFLLFYLFNKKSSIKIQIKFNFF